jgi:hypothetical protein
MAIGSAIFSGIMAISAGDAQRRAGDKAQSAAEQNALSIESETATNIDQLRRTQGQTLGMAKAIIGASGIKFDARKINRVNFSEGGADITTVRTGFTTNTDYSGNAPPPELNPATGEYETPIYQATSKEKSYGEQLSGDLLGSSAFLYLKEMKRNFATDLGFMGKQGRSRAKVTRMGGQVAAMQANAAATSSYASAISSFGSAYEKFNTPKPKKQL